MSIRDARDDSQENSGVIESAADFDISHMGNRKEWKKEKECCVCQDTFSKSNKRLGCKFCHHAVCRDCSPSKQLHPVSKKPERICISCAATGETRFTDSVGSFSATDSRSMEDIESKLQDEEVLRHELERKYTLAIARAERAEAMLDDYKRKRVKSKLADHDRESSQTEMEEMRKSLRIIGETVLKDAPQMITSGRWFELAEEVQAAYKELSESQSRSPVVSTPPQHAGETELTMHTCGSVEIPSSDLYRPSIRRRGETSFGSSTPQKKKPFRRLSIHKESCYLAPSHPKRTQLGFTRCPNLSIPSRQPVVHLTGSLELVYDDRCILSEIKPSSVVESILKREPEAEATCVPVSRSGVSTPSMVVEGRCLRCEQLKKINEELMKKLHRYEQEPAERTSRTSAKPSDQPVDKACACVTF